MFEDASGRQRRVSAAVVAQVVERLDVPLSREPARAVIATIHCTVPIIHLPHAAKLALYPEMSLV